MRREDFSRRSYVQMVGGAVFGSSQIPGRNKRDDTKENVSASDLLISHKQAPSDFEVAESPSGVPLLEYISSTDLRLDQARSAVRGYWKGPNEQNPRWVLSSLAVVCDKPISRRSIEEAARLCYSNYVREYDAETPDYVDFTQSRTVYSEMTDWRMLMRRSGTPTHASDYLFKDVMRLQYHRNVILGTVVFGPDHADRDVDSMLTRFSRLQQSQLRP